MLFTDSVFICYPGTRRPEIKEIRDCSDLSETLLQSMGTAAEGFGMKRRRDTICHSVLLISIGRCSSSH